jgi:NADH-quinone oxidoreductase subunit G
MAADLTVMEETAEFLNRIKKGENLPQFTSCCPAWVKYAEHNAADLLKNLSTCRSPQQIFGSVVKRHWAKKLGKKPEEVFVISIMPCSAKKFEAARPEFSVNGVRDVDLVLTTQELARMIRESGLLFDQLEVEAFDMPFGLTTGAGVIFGATGGVAEAVLRTAHSLLTCKPADEYANDGLFNFETVRGFEGLKEAVLEVDGLEVKVAVVHGLGNAKRLLAEVKEGKANYHLIEVMACPGGCVGGAGQPVATGGEAKKKRAQGLYSADKLSQLRKAHDNPAVARLYEQWLKKPNSSEAHKTLHTSYQMRGRITGEEITLLTSKQENKINLAVCVGTCCYLKGSYDTLKKLMEKAESEGVGDRINLHATFCLENCEKGGPSVRVDDTVVSGVTPDKVESFFTENILGKLKIPAESQ